MKFYGGVPTGGGGGGGGFPALGFVRGFSDADGYTLGSDPFVGAMAATICAWIRPEYFQPGRQTIFGTTDAGSVGGFGLELDANAVRLIFGDGSGSLQDVAAFLDSLPIQRWIQIVGTFVDNGVDQQAILYVNGTRVGDVYRAGITGGITGGVDLVVGSRAQLDRPAAAVQIAGLGYISDANASAQDIATLFEESIYAGAMQDMAWTAGWQAAQADAAWEAAYGAGTLTQTGTLTTGTRTNPLY